MPDAPPPTHTAAALASSALCLGVAALAPSQNTMSLSQESEPDSVWYPHHDTQFHAKVRGVGYVEGATKEETSP